MTGMTTRLRMTPCLLLISWEILAVVSTVPEQDFDCPDPWQRNGDHCYKFVGDKPLKFDSACVACSEDGANLLYVTSAEENLYIAKWLERFDHFRRKWLTSGHGVMGKSKVAEGKTGFQWLAPSAAVLGGEEFWLLEEHNASSELSSKVIAYGAGGKQMWFVTQTSRIVQLSGYGWCLVPETAEHAYICKISKVEAYRIVKMTRNFDHGQGTDDVSVSSRGPLFAETPRSVLVVSSTRKPAVLDCVAFSDPPPTYRWLRGEDFDQEVLASTSPRYSLINGRLVIQNPVEAQDSNTYRCEASNKFGTVISSSVAISFGYLGSFSNVENAPVLARAYEGVAVECSQISFKPAIQYQWVKDMTHFIRPEMQSYIFISGNGKLHFSEVTRSDEGDYQCIAVLTGVNEHSIGTSQPPTRASLPIPVLVQDQAPKADWGPEIQNDFPAVFPQPPLRGQDVRLECFAYGSTTAPFLYSWEREDLPLPDSATFEDHSRVMVIHNAQLEDAGAYTCHVTRTSNHDFRTVYLGLGARPYFVTSLRDQHVDVGSQLTWSCGARGNPLPIYRWYKNGKLLTSDPEQGVQVIGNMLVILNLDAAVHDGMYQCEASNVHGAEMNSAQLRVLSLAPSFARRPLPSQMYASLGCRITLPCNPQGAPLPRVMWLKNGVELLPGAGSRYQESASGSLLIRRVQQVDSGRFTCRAENGFGQDESTTLLLIAPSATISQGPSTVSAIVNDTVFLQCQSSVDSAVDMTHNWYFNSRPLDTSDPSFTVVTNHPTGRNGLYIKGVHFKHKGEYRCDVQTPFSQDFRNGYLSVRGPPGMCDGVQVLADLVTNHSAVVQWTPGEDNGGTIIAFRLEAEEEFHPNHWEVIRTISSRDAAEADPRTPDRHAAEVTNLKPGVRYRFRVAAQNEFGLGTASVRSAYVKTLDAPPAAAPRHVRGGGGSVGELTIIWDLYERDKWGSTSIQYNVYWRRKNRPEKGTWDVAVKSSSEVKHVVLVGEENFYLPFEVKVQAVNALGEGPNSSVVEVFSAEGLPLAAPTNVKAGTYNSTAIEIRWTPVPDTREVVKGKIRGYQINYWPKDASSSGYLRSVRHYGQVDGGLVIGLDPSVKTWLDVQVYNTAGLGPRSEAFLAETASNAPLHYPEEVRVLSAGPGRAKIVWRGVLTFTIEEGLLGYVIYHWNANEDSRSASQTEVPRQVTEYILEGLNDSVLYAVRVAAKSRGGQGRKSPTRYFLFEGSIVIDYNFSHTVVSYLAQATCPKLSLTFILIAICSGMTSRL